MTMRISVWNHDAEDAQLLRADIFRVDRYGQVSDFPRQSREIGPGVTATIHLARNDVLVVRELPLAEDADPADDDAKGGA